MSENVQDLVAAVAAEAEAARADSDDVLVGRGKRRNQEPSRMLSVRLPVDTYDELERLASKMDIPVSALVRGYIIQGVSEQSESVTQTVQRVASEVEKLQRILGK